MRSKLSVMTALTPSRLVPFAAQSRDEPGAVLLAAEDHERRALGLVVLARVVDERLRAVGLGEVARVAALDAVEELVLQADVRERAADHDLVVAATRAVGVEVLAVDAVLGQVLTGRAVGLDGTGRADVVGRDRVAELGEHAGAGDVGDRGRLHRHAVEVRGLANVGGLPRPTRRSTRSASSRLRHRSSPSKTLAYWWVNMSLSIELSIVSCTSAASGQMSLQEDVVAVAVLCRARRPRSRSSSSRRGRRRSRAAGSRGSSSSRRG